MDAKRKTIVVALICVILSSLVIYIYRDITAEIEIQNVKNDYENTINSMSDYVSFIENKNNEYNLKIVKNQELLNELNDELEQKNNSLQQNISELELLKSGNYYDLHDPTYNEILSFIENDKTNEEEYIENVFDCEQFSQQVNTNAEDIGIRCAYVIIYFYDTDAGHGIIGFNTVDRGMVYVEPQTDEWVENLEVGNDFWTDCIIPNGNYIYQESSNDTIKEILLFW